MLILSISKFFQIGLCLFYLGILFRIGEGVSHHHRRAFFKNNDINESQPKSFSKPGRCGTKCIETSSELPFPTTDIPDLISFTEEDLSLTTELILTTLPPTDNSDIPDSTPIPPRKVNFDELTVLLSQKRKECRQISSKTKSRIKTFTCEKLKLSTWLMNQLAKNSTPIFNSYVKLVKNANVSDMTNEAELAPESGPERLVFRLISAFGEPVDKVLFYQLKKYAKSRDLEVTVPHLVSLQMSPRTRSEAVTGRTLFDPGFNLKLKFPFFHDELKVAVATGPSFLAGLSVGLVVIGIKSIFAPFVLAMKAVILSWFFKDMSPLDLVKTLAAPMLPTWLTGMRPEPDMHYPGWQESVEHYEPPQVHNPHDSYRAPSFHGKNTGLMGILSNLLPFSSQPGPNKPMPPYPRPTGHSPTGNFPTGSFPTGNFITGSFGTTGESYRPPPYLENDGRTQLMRPTNSLEGDETTGGEDPRNPTGSALHYAPPTTHQVDMENYDPFYSPLLSRIDSIFMHLGFSDEGCKERAVCSIYKYPVKYAPYSNLLSAQLSKHQRELKRPINTSPKILRYFKYMKAAKDGQAALNCIDLYPHCTNDTEKFGNLPMVKTFQQLTELMGSSTGPSA